MIDGIDIRELDPLDLRQRIGVIFQDFVRYHLPASENIGFGQIEALDRLDQIMESARKSGPIRSLRICRTATRPFSGAGFTAAMSFPWEDPSAASIYERCRDIGSG